MNRLVKILVWISVLIMLWHPAESVLAQEGRPIVVISPGHGWWNDDSGQIDPGAILKDEAKGNLIEKDINLAVAKIVKEYLERCPVDAYLTRDGDDATHTLYDVDEIVNKFNPTLGVSIHTNSGKGMPTGTEGWYTVGGDNDDESARLAGILSRQISVRLGIKNLGSKPETQNRYGGLYIHWWNAPSAIIEIAYLQGDEELIRNRQEDFARSIAQGILEYLEIDSSCADVGLLSGLVVKTYFPGEFKLNKIEIRNNGLAEWKAGDYSLVAQGPLYGSKSDYLLPSNVPVNETAVWNLPAEAPEKPGIYRQTWQLQGEAQIPISKTITIYLVVVPDTAGDIKDNIDRRIEELRQRGEQEIENYLNELEQEIINWAFREIPRITICGTPFLLIIVAAGFFFKSKM